MNTLYVSRSLRILEHFYQKYVINIILDYAKKTSASRSDWRSVS